MRVSVFAIISLCILAFILSVEGSKNLTIHAVPHSHNDAGWLISFDEYYRKTTKHILTNVVNLLKSHPDKTFNWSDMAFFHKWWNEQSKDTQKDVKKLVKENRFVFMGGGWVMNDEALPSYKEMLLQMRLGLDFIQENFGVRPNIGWQIDPFGSSAVTISVLYKLGYDGFVANRMSQNFKDKLSSEDGFNFYWQGHQVTSEHEENVLFTHVLQKHYGLQLPNVWNEGLFLRKNMDRVTDYVYKGEVTPTVKAINAISENSEDDMHVMVTAGDDFMFKDADKVFGKFDQLLADLEKKGQSDGFEHVEADYSTICGYFDGLHQMGLTYGVFKGDFLPYEERFNTWEDFWTGYYSTRLHMKRLIRHVFNDIQSTKTLLAIRAIHHNDNKIDFSGPDAARIDKIQKKITAAEQNWAIMMHHDAITGTHTNHTEPSYYKILKESLNYLESARDLIESNMTKRIPESTIKTLNSHVNSLESPEIFHHTIVNPQGYFRIQILNITVPKHSEHDNYVLLLQRGDQVMPITDAYWADLFELNTISTRPVSIRKVFFVLPMDALSDVQVYVLRSQGEEDCAKEGVTCAKKISPRKINGGTTVTSTSVQVNITSNGDLNYFKSDVHSENFEEKVTYYKTNSQTRSGLYLYNPRHAKIEVSFNTPEIYQYDIGGMLTIVQVYKNSTEERMLKTYVVNQNGCPNLKKQFFMEVQFNSDRVAEYSLTLAKTSHSSSSEHRAYADDSMKLVQRPVFDKHIQIPRTKVDELNGYFTSSCVHGGLLRELYKDETNAPRESYFGWANSNPIGCTFSGPSEVSFLIFRSIGQSDYKGVNDRFTDHHIVSTGFQFYIAQSVDGAMFHKVRANTKLNEPYGIFEKGIIGHDFERIAVSSNLMKDFIQFNNGQSQLSNEFGEVDIADVKLMRHRILESNDDYELAIVLRNRYNGYVQLNRTSKHHEGLFKNDFIDILKVKADARFNNNFDSSKKVLDDERYDLVTLEAEVDKEMTEPSSFHGLEPFEMAEFRIVKNARLEELNIRKQELVDGGSSKRSLACGTFEGYGLHKHFLNGFQKKTAVIIISTLVLLGLIALLKKIRDKRDKPEERRVIQVDVESSVQD